MEIKLKFDDRCEVCSGNGVTAHNYRWDPIPETACYNCDGTGYKLTELGYELVGFLNRHGVEVS